MKIYIKKNPEDFYEDIGGIKDFPGGRGSPAWAEIAGTTREAIPYLHNGKCIGYTTKVTHGTWVVGRKQCELPFKLFYENYRRNK